MRLRNPDSSPMRTASVWAATALTGALAVSAVALSPTVAQAIATTPPLGTLQSVAVLGGQTVTNTGPSIINGDLDLSPGTSVTGFPPGIVNGAVHVGTDPVAGQAQSDLSVAYSNAAGQAPSGTITADLGGQTLVPGVYKASTSMGLTGTLTLNAQGNPNAVWVFQAGSTLTTASASTVALINGASPCNVFWQVGSSATLGTNSNFTGTILAQASITATTGTIIAGRALARTGAVTLDTNTITRPQCATTTGGTTGTTTTGTTATGGLLSGGLLTGGTSGGLLGGITTGGITTGGIVTGGIITGGTISGGTISGGTVGGITTGGTVGGTVGGETGGMNGGENGGMNGGENGGMTGGFHHYPQPKPCGCHKPVMPPKPKPCPCHKPVKVEPKPCLPCRPSGQSTSGGSDGGWGNASGGHDTGWSGGS